MHLASCILLLTSSLAVQARTAGEFFADIPAHILPLFDRNTRLDMLDYFDSQLSTKSKNTLGGASRVVANDSALVQIEISPQASMTLAVIPQRKDTVIALIETIQAPVPDSHVNFYTTDWKKLDIKTPKPEAFLLKNNKKNRAQLPDLLFYTITYVPSRGLFYYINTTPQYYADEKPESMRLLRGAIQYKLDGKKLKEVKF